MEGCIYNTGGYCYNIENNTVPEEYLWIGHKEVCLWIGKEEECGYAEEC